MMSATVKAQSGGVYISPFIQRHSDPETIPVVASIFSANEVDQYGYLKPGVPLAKLAGGSGTLVGIAPAFVYGVTMEAQRLVDPTGYASLAAALTAAGTVPVTVGRRGLVSRALIEEMLGRALTANELAGFVAAGSHIALQQP